MKSIYVYAEVEMQIVLDILKTRGRKHEGSLFSPPPCVWLNWRQLSATVGLIASPLSHPAGLACNEMKAFGWNDLSHPLSSHLLMRARTREWGGSWGGRRRGWPAGRQKALGKLLFNCWGNFNQCRITPLNSIKGKQLEVETRIPLETSALRRVSGMSRETTRFLPFLIFLYVSSTQSDRWTFYSAVTQESLAEFPSFFFPQWL